MADMSRGSTFDSAMMASVASRRCFHHSEGCCSAQPVRTEIISASVLGKNAVLTHLPVSALTREAFTEELPMSYPKRYIWVM